MNKEEERAIIECFFRALDSRCNWSVVGRERPDFEVSDGAVRIGVEHARLFWEQDTGRPRQEGESLRERICDRATALWSHEACPHVWVTLTLSLSIPYRKSDVGRIAQCAVRIAQANCPTEGASRTLDNPGNNPAIWPLEIASLRIARLSGLTATHFVTIDAAFLPELTRDNLQRQVNAKDRLAAGFAHFDHQWLVFSLNSSRPSNAFDLPQPTLSATYRTVFDRLFLFECLRAGVIELKAGPVEQPHPAVGGRPEVGEDEQRQDGAHRC